jgi:hypothetical protein
MNKKNRQVHLSGFFYSFTSFKAELCLDVAQRNPVVTVHQLPPYILRLQLPYPRTIYEPTMNNPTTKHGMDTV